MDSKDSKFSENNSDPDYVIPLKPIRSPKHYFLRSRPRITYMEEDLSDDESDEEYTGKNDEDGEEEEDLVITISQLKKKKDTEDTKNVIIPNASLECIPFPIQNFSDLYKLARICHEEKKLFKDCQKLPLLFPVLTELNNMIGLQTTKNGICNMILFELQNLPSYWRHIVLTGKPGVGKTNVAQIIAKLLNRMGKAPSDEITIGNPLNMIAKYEGQTKNEVHRVVQEALSKSGVLLIDEAPSLNNNRGGQSDAYGQQCIDMLMQLMDKHRNELIVIFAGYKNEIERNILQVNPGLRRRIQWFFHLDDYSPLELHQIFLQQMTEAKFQLSPNSIFTVDWMEDHIKDFPNFGGSIETFVYKIKHVQTRKTFGQIEKVFISDETIQEGFNMYKTYVITPMRTEQAKVEAEIRSQLHNNNYNNHTHHFRK
jgi:SpoVK/Ycf46/Vps4 family AAA+-type ATPase